MGKKKGLAAIFSKPKLAAADGSPSPPWPWPSCANNPQTASFRRQGHGGDDRPCTTAGRSVTAAGRLLPRDAAGDMYETVNSVYFDPADPFCSFDNEEDGDYDNDALVDDCVSFSTTTASEEWSEAVIRSLSRSSTDRFFFDSGPPPASNSILAASRSPSPSPGRTLVTQSPRPKAPLAAAEMPDTEGDSDDDVEEERHQEAAASTSPLVQESVAVALDSDDPYHDFRASMEEMVAAHGLRDWPSLQEMLLWYLRINGKRNHALILGAFVDLLVGLVTSGSRSSAMTSATTTTTMTTTTTAATTSSSSSSTSSIAGDGATCSTAATTTNVDEQCSGGSSGTDASCSPAASSSDQEDEEEEPVRKKASDELALHVKLCT